MSPRPLRFEALEQRRLLAVDVALRGGDLVIRGDGDDDDVELLWLSDRSLEITANGTTTSFTAAELAAGLRDDILIDLGGGGNTLTIFRDDSGDPLGRIPDALTITGGNGGNTIEIEGLHSDDLMITLGNGEDTISITDVVVRHDAKITLGAEDDELSLSDVNIGRDLVINDSGGEDYVFVDGVVVSDDLTMKLLGSDDKLVDVINTTVRDELKIDTGSGRDQIFIEQGTRADNLVVTTGSGDDTVYITASITDDLRLRLGGGDDEAYLVDSLIDDNAQIEGEAGEDTILIFSVVVGDDIRAVGGAGDDLMAVVDVEVDNLKIEGGDGGDQITVEESTILRKLTIVAGSGDNVVALEDTSVAREASVQTGNGEDQIRFANVLIRNGLSIKTGDDDDAIVLDRETEIGGALSVDGGRGANNVENFASTSRSGRLKNVTEVGEGDIDPAAFDNAFDDVENLIDDYFSQGPSFTSPDEWDVEENSTTVGEVTALSDSPLRKVNYLISGGEDQDKFEIDPETGELFFIAAPDFEMPTDDGANNTYEVIVGASDGVRTGSQVILVNVTPVNEFTPVFTSTPTANVAENTTAVMTVTAEDDDLPPPTLAFSIFGGADADEFEITTGGVLTFKSAPDFEMPSDADANNIYIVTVRVSDGGGKTSDQTISVTVTNVAD